MQPICQQSQASAKNNGYFFELAISHLCWVVARLTTEALTIFTIFSVENTQMHYITMISKDF